MTVTSSAAKRKVLIIGPGTGAVDEYQQLCADYDVHLVTRGPRSKVKPAIQQLCETKGPFDAMVMFFANGGYAPMDEDLLAPLWQNGNKVGCIAQCGTGYDNVVVDDISAHGCFFTNTPDAVTMATADFTVFLFLSALRGGTMVSMAINSGIGHAAIESTTDPAGLTVGIIGMGRIAQDFSRKIRPFGCDVQYFKRSPLPAEKEAELGVRYAAKDELVRTSDVIVVLVPGTAETYHMLDTADFAAMKDGVFIVNSSRGTVINEPALVAALESNKVKRAALDVFEHEPTVPPYFLNNPRVTISPHVAAYSTGTMYRGERDAMANVRAYLESGTPLTPVNGPF